jgi:lipoprotein-anchoring transpeptidase ErfK/SrfK
MVCSTGFTAGRTPVGTFKIGTKRRWLNSPKSNSHPHLYEQFACRINGNIWIHSTCFHKSNPNTLERDSYLDLGQPVSAGCIRLSVRDALWIFANCLAGTSVKVLKSGGPPAVCVEALPPLPDGAAYDPTDPAVLH